MKNGKKEMKNGEGNWVSSEEEDLLNKKRKKCRKEAKKKITANITQKERNGKIINWQRDNKLKKKETKEYR